MPAEIRYVALGDSFTEGVGDIGPSGGERGWADLVAQGWASSIGRPIQYANLAIRGRLMEPIVAEQLEEAIALNPTHLSLNGGGNDMIRPRPDLDRITRLYRYVVERCAEAGVNLVIPTGAPAPANFPVRRLFMSRGDQLLDAVLADLGDPVPVTLAINWGDESMMDLRYWAPDRLHLNTRGHHRVAARVLGALGHQAPTEWWDLPGDPEPHPGERDYYRQIMGPWLSRHLRRVPAPEPRVAKLPQWSTISPAS